MIVGVAGTKGVPGVTTVAYGISWFLGANRPVALIEADPDGGAMAARLGLPQEPGLATLAAAGRHELSAAMFASHLQASPLNFALLLAPSAPGQARAALRAMAESLEQAIQDLQTITVVVDLGRLDLESPSLPLVANAEHILVVTQPTLEGTDALAVRIAERTELRSRAELVTVGPGAYDGRDIAEALSVQHVGHLPRDPVGADTLWSLEAKSRSRCRRPLLRALGLLATRLVAVETREAHVRDDKDSSERMRRHRQPLGQGVSR